MKIIIEEVVNKYSNMVLQIAYQKTFNMSDAEDITQEVFIRLLENQEKIKNDKHLKAWIIRVTSNLSNDYNKNFWNRNMQQLDEKQEMITKEDKGVFDEVEKIKPPIYRDIIYLYFYQGYKIKEIAKILDMNINTVSSCLTRAKQKLRDIIEEGEIYEQI